MRRNWRSALALTAVLGLFLAACADDEGDGDATQEEQTDDSQTEEETSEATDGEDSGDGDTQGADGEEVSEEELEELLGGGGGEDLPDPNEDVEDGIYRGSGVVLPVPEGWSLDPAAAQQGIVAAMSEEGGQLTAQAIDGEQAAAAGGEPLDFDALLDSTREQIGEEPDSDESVDLAGADQAQALTFRALPAPQEGQSDSDVTIVVATDGEGRLGQFVYAASSDTYDDEVASALVDEAGFDADSSPPELPQPQQQPAPEQDGQGEDSPEDS